MIEGKLVNLRAREMSDLEHNTRWVNDREVTRYILVRYPMSAAAEEAWMRPRVAAPLSLERIDFAIDTKDGRHIGNCHLAAAPEDRKAMLGIMIGEKDCWSQGYGSDAVVSMLRFGFDEMNLNRIALEVFDDNERAQACYRRCGFTEEGRMRDAAYYAGAYHGIVVMSILRDEFYAMHSDATTEAVR